MAKDSIRPSQTKISASSANKRCYQAGHMTGFFMVILPRQATQHSREAAARHHISPAPGRTAAALRPACLRKESSGRRYRFYQWLSGKAARLGCQSVFTVSVAGSQESPDDHLQASTQRTPAVLPKPPVLFQTALCTRRFGNTAQRCNPLRLPILTSAPINACTGEANALPV